MTAARERLVRVVAEALDLHVLVAGIRDLRKHCTCGWVSDDEVPR